MSDPVVVLYNNLEAFYGFLSRASDPQVMGRRLYRGDRALMWCGPAKLVIASAPVEHLAYLQSRFDFTATRYMSPAEATPFLSHDVLREPHLLDAIIQQAGESQRVALIPYSTTSSFLDLVDTLRDEHGLIITTPESPSRANHWLQGYADSKAGFRQLAQVLALPAPVPEGYICRSLDQAADVIGWFVGRGVDCIAKADQGEGSLGHAVFDATDPINRASIEAHLHANDFYKDDVLIVERYITSPGQVSPSLEFFVPAAGTGDPCLTYAALQQFNAAGRFSGVTISREQESAGWYQPVLDSGLMLAHDLQEKGYVGHFDLDGIVDADGKSYLLEMNARRTGGTHAHEFAYHVIGANYLDSVAIACLNKMACPGITTLDGLLAAIGDLHYDGQRGVIVSVTSSLAMEQCGCLIVDDTIEVALAMQTRLEDRLRRGVT